LVPNRQGVLHVLTPDEQRDQRLRAFFDKYWDSYRTAVRACIPEAQRYERDFDAYDDGGTVQELSIPGGKATFYFHKCLTEHGARLLRGNLIPPPPEAPRELLPPEIRKGLEGRK